MHAAATADIVRTTSAASEHRYQVEVISDHRDLVALQPEWDRLVEQVDIGHPFLDYQWIRTWWECFGAGRQLHILLVRDGAQIRAIAPLMLCTVRMYGLSVRCLASVCNPHTPRFGVIAAAGAEGIYRCLWSYLRNIEKEWDILELAHLPHGSDTLNWLSRLGGEDGYPIGLWRGEKAPWLAFEGTWESYFQGLKTNHRTKMRRNYRRLTRLGPLRLEVVSGGGRLDEALDEGIRIEAAAWKGRHGTAIRCDPVVEQFYRLLGKRTADDGTLRLVFLTLDGERIAFAYALFSRDTYYVLKTGYEPSYARYSPYNILCYLLLQEGFAKGLREFEFLGRDEPWKMQWAQDVHPHVWLFIFARNLRARFLHRVKFRWVPRLRRLRDLARKTFRSAPR